MFKKSINKAHGIIATNKIPPVPKDAYPTVMRHLRNIVPMRNPHGTWNAVQEYCTDNLPGYDIDRHRNIMRIPNLNTSNLNLNTKVRLAIVGHTDSVYQDGNKSGKDKEPFTEVGGIISSRHNKRPIGGDDKVGVAIALTIGNLLPHVSVILPADEEIGCVGSSQIDIPYHDLMIQCDRRGASDLVTTAYGSEIASDECARLASHLLPHRKEVDGMLTDVLTLTERGLCGNAFNLSCGYYDPHTAHEFIVLSQVWQAFLDVWTLLHGIPADQVEVATPYVDEYYADDYERLCPNVSSRGTGRWGAWDVSDELNRWYRERDENAISGLEEDTNR